jgi:hypothetical protein
MYILQTIIQSKIRADRQHTFVLTVVLVELSFRNHNSAKQKIESLRSPQQVQAWETLAVSLVNRN